MKFELEDLLTLIDRVSQTGTASFEYKDQDVKLKICGACAVQAQETNAAQGMDMTRMLNAAQALNTAQPMNVTQPVQQSAASGETVCAPQEENSVYVESPMVGTFYAAPAQDAQPFVQVGDHVKKGQTVGIVEAMKLMNEIEAECDGIVREILVKNEQMVEYGQKLIRISEE